MSDSINDSIRRRLELAEHLPGTFGSGNSAADHWREDVTTLLAEIDALRAENARLNLELRRLQVTDEYEDLRTENEHLIDVDDRLRAELDRVGSTRDALRADNERLQEQHGNDMHTIDVGSRANAGLEIENEELHSQVTTLEWSLSEATKAAERLTAILTKGQAMIDSLDDDGEFDTDAVHAFAVALNEILPVA